jgi:hypothetical protein
MAELIPLGVVDRDGRREHVHLLDFRNMLA